MDVFHRRGLALACITLVLNLGAAAPQAAPKPAQKPEDLAGSWKLNEELSEDPRAGLRRGGGGRGPGGGGRPPGGGPRGGGGGGGRPRGGEDGFRRPPMARDEIVALAGGSKSLLIEAQGPQLTLIYGDNRHLLFTDGRKIRKERAEGEEILQRTRWREEHLEIETTAGNAKVTEVWVLTNDRKRIFATVEIDPPGPMPKISFKRVWDRVETAG